MKAETEPISDDEWLLRRVRIEEFREGSIPLISANAFKPRVEGREPDTTGISLYREACLADPSDISATVPVEKRHESGIVRTPMTEFQSGGLTVVASLAPIPGHVVVSELNADAYRADKGKFAPIKDLLATVAFENIVLHPGEA